MSVCTFHSKKFYLCLHLSVVWNPWAEKAAQMADLDGHAHFLCVEAGHVTTPLPLAPGARWVGAQTLTVVDAK